MTTKVWAVVVTMTAVGCFDPDDFEQPGDVEVAAELEARTRLGGKEDSVAVKTLPVDSYATEAWVVTNQWQDTLTAAARKAGIAWGADSGLNWDEKYALWVQSLEPVDRFDGWGETFELTTPFGKQIVGPKLDCADVSLMMRATFAAWYKLPFVIVASDGSTPVFFGHFGIRTASGNWNGMPLFKTAYPDYTWMTPADYQASWPRDEKLRKLGVQDGDDQPFLEPGARTGAYLDEIHLNKRAARLIRLLLVFTGSMHLADSRNTYNLTPEALRAGDTNLWRWQAQGVGHTMVTMRVLRDNPAYIEAHSVYGNLPPDQPIWDDPVATKLAYTDPRAGGADELEDYAPLNGGLKRWRVARNINGYWRNTFMAADESSWINDTDLESLRARPTKFESLLGQASPEERRDSLLTVIESKRNHLRTLPASCSARTAREKAFEKLYELMWEEFFIDQLTVDRMYRSVDDYVFAELVYEQSRTCCWNSTTPEMYATIVDLDATLRAEATACVAPMAFKARDRDYAIYRKHRPDGWRDWEADEACPWASQVVDDVEAAPIASPFCDVFGAPQ